MSAKKILALLSVLIMSIFAFKAQAATDTKAKDESTIAAKIDAIRIKKLLARGGDYDDEDQDSEESEESRISKVSCEELLIMPFRSTPKTSKLLVVTIFSTRMTSRESVTVGASASLRVILCLLSGPSCLSSRASNKVQS